MRGRRDVAATKKSDRGLLRSREPEDILQPAGTGHHPIVVPPGERRPRPRLRVVVKDGRLIELVVGIGSEHRRKGRVENQPTDFRSEITEPPSSDRRVQAKSIQVERADSKPETVE